LHVLFNWKIQSFNWKKMKFLRMSLSSSRSSFSANVRTKKPMLPHTSGLQGLCPWFSRRKDSTKGISVQVSSLKNTMPRFASVAPAEDVAHQLNLPVD